MQRKGRGKRAGRENWASNRSWGPPSSAHPTPAHHHHAVQVCHLRHTALAEQDDCAGGVQAPPACPARHLHVLSREQVPEGGAIMLPHGVKHHCSGRHIYTHGKSLCGKQDLEWGKRASAKWCNTHPSLAKCTLLCSRG